MAPAARHASLLLPALSISLLRLASLGAPAAADSPGLHAQDAALAASLAADDECGAGPGLALDERCVLNVLQLRHQKRATSDRREGALAWTNASGHADADESEVLALSDPATIQSYVQGKGYPFEVHYVTTGDGLRLALFRLPRPGAPPVHLQHGLMDSAWAWVFPGEGFKALAFQIYDAGYDVWLGNNRGNLFSLHWANGKYAGDDRAFWDFSFDQMGRYDVPAFTTAVIEKTGWPKLAYVGHSQGTTQMFIAASLPELKPNVSDRISVFVALSPVAWLGHMKSPLFVALARGYIEQLAWPLFPHGRLLTGSTTRGVFSMICMATFGVLCSISVASTVGTGLLDLPNAVTDEADKFPYGTSFKNLIHFAQGVRDRQFRKYDYGAQNMEKYGQATPPSYNVTRDAGVPIALLNGQYDMLCAYEDIGILRKAMPPAAIVFDKDYPRFSHLTWMLGSGEAAPYVADVLTLLRKYQPLNETVGNATAATGNASVAD